MADKKLKFEKEYKELERIAERLASDPDGVREDGMSVIITIADDERVLTAGYTGNLEALQYSIMLVANGMLGDESDEEFETDGNLN